ncbi:2-amino-4-hydroxy-6-hydroxymethyldihydropteridine diphosphokinase [Phormidium tenue]|uniref:2-amino-4-hydroxy-6-hydroxymethyldihydropteridine diphosphokinase n=1 Tax=Phormidium tenue NIES-30 TaxID=549789 RepID=A0A1U7J1E1_9CYAN|nr:2-amino-4-hydroxy-6-hydroxymethyldihydropteridine diphosphokinase [Phormidium tenue]MBD2233925.1 2-amino-4-hydroxy-6-hydroxymethyldihydropteridine diphosphokinase [Phormidium tenue FACHB-1052]OKH45710.1 2-amino-4-hydroxy-6-hydroxymethyldihydropteridine diphosphokinase [Phormidium tenue NIES-30]
MTAVPCAIALGSNLGNSRKTLQQALTTLAHCPDIDVIAQSSLYQTVAIGPPQPDILNACALLKTSLSAQDLLHQLLATEQHFGRVRRERWGPRTLDLDLLFYGQSIITEPALHVPHPRLRERAFVLIPLAEIAPHWRDPVSGQLIHSLCQAVDPTGVQPLGPISASS